MIPAVLPPSRAAPPILMSIDSSLFMNAKSGFMGLLVALVFAPVGNLFGQAIVPPQVDFTLAVNTSVDPGSTYTNFNAAGAGSGDTYVIGFTVDVTAVDNVPVTLEPMASFCIELSESISATSYTFDSGLLFEASAGRAGELGTASSNIPTGGIGQLRAARLRYLFDNYYQSSSLSAWTQNSTTPNIHAFQLALWELSHDVDLSLTNTSGSIFFTGSQGSTLRNNAIALAGSWLADIDQAGITESYVSTNYDIWSLLSSSGNPEGGRGFQDIVLAVQKNTPTHDLLVPLLPIPEPSSAVLALVGSVMLMRRRRL